MPLMRAVPVALVVALSACGGSSPIGPTPTPVITPAALFIAAASDMELIDVSEGWRFRAQGINRGLGCAANVRAVVTFKTPEGTTIETLPALAAPPETVVLPSATFTLEGCCMTKAKYQDVPDVFTSAVFQWEPIACPKF